MSDFNETWISETDSPKLRKFKISKNSSIWRQIVKSGKTYGQTVRTSKYAPNLHKSLEDSDVLADWEADITLLSVRSKQLYTRSIGWRESIVFGKDLSSILTLKFSHSGFHSCIVWLHLSLRHYYFLPNTSSLLQAKNAKCDDKYSVYKMCPDVLCICEMHVRMKLYRAACSLSDANWHFFPNQNNSCYCSRINVSLHKRI
jgi:hypothetical protein